MKRSWKPGVCLCLAVVFLLTLSGCAALRENRRLRKLAERYAGPRAEAYIQEKYGIEAQAQGYDLQGAYTLYFAANGNVLVPMAYGEERFCVFLNLEDKSFLFDNRQRGEIYAALEDYVLGLYALPAPAASETSFQGNSMRYFMDDPLELEGVAYSTDGMVGFYYQGETGMALLDKLFRVSYSADYTALDRSLEDLELRPEDWSAQKPFQVDLDLYLYRDQESYGSRIDSWLTPDPKPENWPVLMEYRHLALDNGPPSSHNKPDVEEEFYAYHTESFQGLLFSGTMPFDAASTIGISVEQPVWRRVESWNSAIVNEYKPVSPLFFMRPTGAAQDGSGATEGQIACIVPRSFFEAVGEEELNIGTYHPDSGEIWVGVTVSIDRQGETRPRIAAFTFDLPEDGENAVQYVLLALTSSYKIPNETDGESENVKPGEPVDMDSVKGTKLAFSYK